MTDSERELSELRQRIAEAEATLEAIREGRVDALVIDDAGEQSVYTLESADLPYRKFLEQMGEGAASLDARGRVVFANRFFAELVGRDASSVLDTDFTSYLNGPDRDTFRSALEETSDGSTRRIAATLRSPRHRALPVQVGLAVSGTHQDRRYMVVVTDLSERERLREVSAAHEAVEAESIAKDLFLAALGHELRTPLGVVLGWTQMLLQRSDTLDDSVKRGLTAIERSATLQRTLIEDVLDLARISAGKLTTSLVRLDLTGLVRASVSAFEPRAKAAGIALAGNVEDGATVLGDDTRIQQLLHNLLENAFKFTPRDGYVTVGLAVRGGRAVLSVSDSGVGIEPELLPRVFERYRQRSSSATRTGGLGLGLSIAKHISDLHGGQLSVHSQGLGQGTTFSWELALAADDIPSDGGGHAALSGLRLLIIDDEDEPRELLQRVLSRLGAEVVEADGSARALALLESEPFDCIVSDLLMGAGDGYDFATKVRARLGTNQPLVALSSLARASAWPSAESAGFDAYLQKPAQEGTLLQAIKAARARHHA